MELRIDRLLARLKNDPEKLLAAIDADPLLMKREIDGLVLANATKELFTPQEERQLFAKGIVFERNPHRLVSLPLLKIYNLGERNVTVYDLAGLTAEGASISFLRKFDGSMVQRFQHGGRVYFTTRGMIEGVTLSNPEPENHFDYLGAARQIASKQFPALLEAKPEWEGLTFILELLHPGGRVITDYGPREDLVLIAVFDRRETRYWTYREINQFAKEHGLSVTELIGVAGDDLPAQIEHMLSGIRGTDQEGSVINFETTEVLYRVKVKSPDYLRLLKLMVNCTYSATVEILRSKADFPKWDEFQQFLQAQGTDKVPEEVLSVYREHYNRYASYREVCERLREWASRRADEVLATIPEGDIRARRRAFAMAVQSEPLMKPLFFSAFDGRLTLEKVEGVFDTPEEANQALAGLN
ncbi:RNA ligase [Zavarzinella formosa]|uniref:RNA ligase n=1 Tax=Zavarzinella formosa TaxID=360055 RepID=UPI0002EB4786|nr:RNA ligase [Zavarzinella formosa]